MTIAELGALGEFLGLFVIMATLIYLAVQTNQAKRIALAEARRNIGNDFISIWGILGRDERLTRLVRLAVNDWDALGKNEQMLVHAFFVNLLAHLDAALNQEETLPELKRDLTAWEDNVLGLLTSPGGAVWFENTSYLYNPLMVEHLRKRLAAPESLPPSWNSTMAWWQVDEVDQRALSTGDHA